MISGTNRSMLGVDPGAVYRRIGAGSAVEMALVREVAPDRMGIPHVRYRLWVSRGNCAPFAEERTLSLEAFRNRYRERVQENKTSAAGTRQ